MGQDHGHIWDLPQSPASALMSLFVLQFPVQAMGPIAPLPTGLRGVRESLRVMSSNDDASR